MRTSIILGVSSSSCEASASASSTSSPAVEFPFWIPFRWLLIVVQVLGPPTLSMGNQCGRGRGVDTDCGEVDDGIGSANRSRRSEFIAGENRWTVQKNAANGNKGRLARETLVSAASSVHRRMKELWPQSVFLSLFLRRGGEIGRGKGWFVGLFSLSFARSRRLLSARPFSPSLPLSILEECNLCVCQECKSSAGL